MATLEAAMMKEVDAILADGVSNEEVSRAKKLMLASAVYARDSVSHGARVLGAALASGQTVTDVESWPERIQNVTAEQIVDAARAVFKAEMSVTTRLLGLEAPSQ
jgi:zinc protease